MLKKKHPELTLDIIGRGADESLQLGRGSPKEGTVLRGFVDDLEPYYRKSKVFIAPLRFGSGTKVKVITALVPGITLRHYFHRCGRTGPVARRKEIMLADDAKAWLLGIGTLLTDRSSMGIHARCQPCEGQGKILVGTLCLKIT
jgi:glycosyltransferase involved in cell wall biosynthesis